MGSENEYTNGGTFGTQHLKVHTLTCAWRSCELLKGPLQDDAPEINLYYFLANVEL